MKTPPEGGGDGMKKRRSGAPISYVVRKALAAYLEAHGRIVEHEHEDGK